MNSLHIVILFFSVIADASPHPGVGSSLLVSPEHSLFFARKGFHLSAQSTGWKMEGKDAPDPQQFDIHFLQPENSSGFLSLKTETLTGETSLESYAHKWLRDYRAFGFEILGSKTFSQSNAKGLVVDFIHAKKSKQIRQVIFLHEKTAVILTCTDNTTSFKQTLVGCNSIIRTFAWTTSDEKRF